jgi:zinc D-Ala-D-Ala carboxypeptidase
MKKFDTATVTKSDTAIRREINEQFTPGPTVIANAKALYDNVLCKLPESIAYIITSWYRCPRLNKLIGGSSTSDHMSGRSADLDSANNMSNAELFNFIRTNCDFDNNTNPDWVHVSYRSSGNRKQVLRAVKSNGKTIYRTMA